MIFKNITPKMEIKISVLGEEPIMLDTKSFF